MKAPRLWPAFLLGAASALILACGDRSPLGVAARAPTPHSDLIGGLLAPSGLLTCQPLPYDSTTQTIGPDGGTIYIGSHSLDIPAGALPSPTMITAVDRKSTRLNSSHSQISYAVFCLKKKKKKTYTNVIP